MGLLIQKTDFVGKWTLAKNANDNISAYIEQYEESLLIQLLGKDLFELFKDDVNVTTHKPETAKYLVIYEKLVLDWCGREWQSDGMKNMLLGLIYFEQSRDNRQKQSMAGLVQPKVETADAASPTLVYTRYNDAVLTAKIIQQYILDNSEEYPDFNGQDFHEASFI